MNFLNLGSRARPIKLAGLGMLCIATVAFGALALRETYQQMSALSLGEAAGLIPALGLMVLTVLGFAVSWSFILRCLEPRDGSRGALVSTFLLTWPARYVPGTVPYHVTRIMLGERLGFRKTAVTASIFYEAIIQVGSAVLLGFAVLLIEFAVAGRGWVALAPFLPLLALPLLLQPRIFVPAANALLKRAGRKTLGFIALSQRSPDLYESRWLPRLPRCERTCLLVHCPCSCGLNREPAPGGRRLQYRGRSRRCDYFFAQWPRCP